MFGLIKKFFVGSLTGGLGSIHTKCLLLRNQKWIVQPTLLNFRPNEHSQELQYYPFTVKLDRPIGICNTLNDLSIKVCVPNNAKVQSIHVFDTVTGKNDLGISTKDISCKFKCKFDGRNCNPIQKWNNN